LTGKNIGSEVVLILKFSCEDGRWMEQPPDSV